MRRESFHLWMTFRDFKYADRTAKLLANMTGDACRVIAHGGGQFQVVRCMGQNVWVVA